MPAMTSSFRCTGKLLNRRHAHTHIHYHTGIQDPNWNIIFTCYKCSRCYLCYTGVMSQPSQCFFFTGEKKKAQTERETKKWFVCFARKSLQRGIKLWFVERNKLPVVYLSFHTAVLHPLFQTHTSPVYATTFPYHPIPINSDENFRWAFQSKSRSLGGLLTGLNERESIFDIDCGIFWVRSVCLNGSFS